MKPWLWFPAGTAHKLSPLYLKPLSLKKPQILWWNSFIWEGLEFPNPLGISGGVDKNAQYIKAWWALGTGFIEVGTITPQAQKGNKGRVLDRSVFHKAVWNYMGFPNKGVKKAYHQIQKLIRPYPTPVFINIGKNFFTSQKEAFKDYIFCIKTMGSMADAFVINISSPNTPGLRDLLKPENLKNFLNPITKEQKNLGSWPLLLKISPDISEQELKTILDISDTLGIKGWILTNSSNNLHQELPFPDKGGISGKPLKQKSLKLLKTAVKHLGSDKKKYLLISSGGVLTTEDVFERLESGANLVQVYSALLFEGPSFFKKTALQAGQNLREKMRALTENLNQKKS